jgi:hypothetical protein
MHQSSSFPLHILTPVPLLPKTSHVSNASYQPPSSLPLSSCTSVVPLSRESNELIDSVRGLDRLTSAAVASSATMLSNGDNTSKGDAKTSPKHNHDASELRGRVRRVALDLAHDMRHGRRAQRLNASTHRTRHGADLRGREARPQSEERGGQGAGVVGM